jgi:hypothetical protein
MIEFSGLSSGEVHQRCVLISGRCSDLPTSDNTDYIRVRVFDSGNGIAFPEQRWPLSHGWFKALVMLSPGQNTIRFDLGTDDSLQESVGKRFLSSAASHRLTNSKKKRSTSRTRRFCKRPRFIWPSWLPRIRP